MKELYGDLFSPNTYRTDSGSSLASPGIICITTNGFVKKNGEAVMGKGCAKRACELFDAALPDRAPSFANRVGRAIINNGNIAQTLGYYSFCNATIFIFPVKPAYEKCEHNAANIVKHMQSRFKYGDTVPGWACKARMELIKRSAQQFVSIANERFPGRGLGGPIVLPRPGCGAGELEWEDVKPELDKILDDRFYAITYNNSNGATK